MSAGGASGAFQEKFFTSHQYVMIMVTRGVLLFWALSGFCITLHAQGARGGFGRMTVGYYHIQHVEPPVGGSLKPPRVLSESGARVLGDLASGF